MTKDNFLTDDPEGSLSANLDHLTPSASSDSSYVKRNVVVDECNFTEKFLKCVICEKLYDNDNRQPKLLPCHHTLCKVCTLKIFLTEAEYKRIFDELPDAVNIICPQCCASFISTQEGLKQLPTDHRVIQLIDFVASYSDRQVVQYCEKHKTQPVNFICEFCVKLICRDCTVVDHTEVKGHTVRDLESALKKYSPIIEVAMSELESEKSALKEKRQELEQSIENFDKAENDVVEQVRTSFAALKAALEEREKQLIAKAEKEVGKEKEKFREKIELIDKRSQDIDEKYNELKKCKEDGNVEDMYKVSQNIHKYKPASPLKLRDSNDGNTTKFSFNDREEKYLTNRIENYGDILSRIESSSRTSSTSSYSMPYRYSYYRP